jgi:hypothetical protein
VWAVFTNVVLGSTAESIEVDKVLHVVKTSIADMLFLLLLCCCLPTTQASPQTSSA